MLIIIIIFYLIFQTYWNQLRKINLRISNTVLFTNEPLTFIFSDNFPKGTKRVINAWNDPHYSVFDYEEYFGVINSLLIYISYQGHTVLINYLWVAAIKDQTENYFYCPTSKQKTGL